MKEITSADIKKIEERIKKAAQQNPEIIILNLKGEKNYTKQQATEKAKTTLQSTQKFEALKEVWLLWKGDVIRVKK